MRAIFLLILGCLTACAIRKSDAEIERELELANQEWLRERRDECLAATGVCWLETLPELSLNDLKNWGAAIKIDCNLAFVDHTEITAKAECEGNILAAMEALVARYPEQLSSVSRGQLRYELTDDGCISLTNGYCACTFSGFAEVPLVWKRRLED
ncbi:hypothetical protein C7S18_19840 [Ahniella affigens]|uniref:Uncharacterized protein n=2 Tax=Ahniella affigens TaxID=2021234 RepID=A0A2P1PWR6_9GAMM|nr:hypothetical protein C7S18_19840 [Ahniella affigens]